LIRHVPPAYSPVSVGAIWAGLKALAGLDRSRKEVIVGFLGERFRARSVLLADSGTSALALGFRAVARSSGDRPLALPAYGCFDLATAAEAADVRVLLYDLEPSTLGPDWDSLRAVLSQGAGALVIAHLFGIPVEISKALSLAEEYGVPLIEDAAQAAGATYDGCYVGSFGTLGIVSFGRGKGMTGGAGGALYACDEKGVTLLEGVRGQVGPPRAGPGDVATAGATWLLAWPAVYGLPASLPWLHLGETRHRDPAPSTEMSRAGIGVLSGVLQQLSTEESVRRLNAQRLTAAVRAGSPAIENVCSPKRSLPGYLRFPVIERPEEAGGAAWSPDPRVGAVRSYPRSLDRLSRFRSRIENSSAKHPGSGALVERLITLPTHSRLSDRDLDRLEVWIGSGLKAAGGSSQLQERLFPEEGSR
jgi:dTDP-4-amino-4,6-dideoxygalactose transaminase